MLKVFLPSVAIAALVAGQALAQAQPGTQPKAGQKPTATTTTASQGESQQLEQHAAACLLIGNQEEIALSEIGIEDAQSDEVKEFAREMVKEHTKLISKLRKFTPQNASFELQIKTEDKAAVNGARKTDETSAGSQTAKTVRAGETTTAKTAAAGSLTDQLLMIHRDAAENCLQMTKQELQKRKGAEFDKAFMTAQCTAHVAMWSKLKALEGKTSGEFNDLVAEGKKSTEEHLEQAKEIMNQLSSNTAGSASEGREPRAERAPRRELREPGEERAPPRRERPSPPPRGDRPAPRDE